MASAQPFKSNQSLKDLIGHWFSASQLMYHTIHGCQNLSKCGRHCETNPSRKLTFEEKKKIMERKTGFT